MTPNQSWRSMGACGPAAQVSRRSLLTRRPALQSLLILLSTFCCSAARPMEEGRALRTRARRRAGHSTHMRPLLMHVQDSGARAACAACVLGRIAPSHTYLHQLCSAGSQLVASGLPAQSKDVLVCTADEGGEQECLAPWPMTPHPTRMLDNPLFT